VGVVAVIATFAWRRGFSYRATDLSPAHDDKYMKINNRTVQVGYIVGVDRSGRAKDSTMIADTKIRAPRHAAMMRVTLRRRLGKEGMAALS
jgi:hypothetical protein